MAKWNIGAFLRTLTKGAEMKNFPPVEQAEEDRSALAQERCPAAEDAAARSELKGALLEGLASVGRKEFASGCFP